MTMQMRGPRGTGPTTRARVTARVATAAAAVVTFAVIAAIARPEATARGSVATDAVRAARMLGDWRYDEARPLIARMDARAPGAVETRYLKAQLAFLDGDYPSALRLLDGLAEAGSGVRVGAGAGELRALVASTYETTSGFARHASADGHFAIFYPPGVDEVIADLAADTLEAAYRALGEDFGYFPPEVVRVELLSAPSDLAKLSTLTEREIETTGTIALCKYGKLMVVSPRATMFGYPWMDTLVHEYVHYVVSRMSHDTVPVWLHEGLARFEQTRWRSQPRTALAAMDEHLLASALKSGRLVTFDEMHPSMAKLPSAEAAALAFAEVYTMVGYLHEQIGYPGLRAIIERQRDGASAQRAVSEVVGRRWIRVEGDWKAHLRARGLKSRPALLGRAKAPRVRFQKGGRDKAPRARARGGENVGVDEVAGEQARNFARLGGMLRARGMTEAAAIEYEKALAAGGAGDPDPFIAGKLARTYLELGRHADAVRLAAPLLALDEHDAAAAVTLGLAHRALGDTGAARTAFESALAVSPFDPTTRCGLAELYEAASDRRSEREREACRRLRR